jgi:hypothetical protein
VGEWSWYDNPFIGSRQFAALVAVNLLLNNWDLKTSNNKIYLVTSADAEKRQRYVVRDLGGSLGRAYQPRFLRWIPFMRDRQGTKNNLEDFEAQPFVAGMKRDRIDFSYRGLDEALAESLTVSDLRWTCALLSRLSDQQWQDAFRAGGYTADQRARYIHKIREKLAEAEMVGAREPATASSLE